MAKRSDVGGLLDDETNRKILQTYLEDSRRSIREVARRVGVAPGTVIARTKQMEDSGLIDRYTIKLNPSSAGYTITAFIQIVVREGAMMDPAHELAKCHEVCGLYNTTGGSDTLIIAKFRSMEDLNTFTTKLIKHPDVAKTHTSIALTTLREEFNIL